MSSKQTGKSSLDAFWKLSGKGDGARMIEAAFRIVRSAEVSRCLVGFIGGGVWGGGGGNR